MLGSVIAGPDVTWVLASEEETQVVWLQKIGERTAGVRAAQSIDGEEPLGVALGFSTVREGLDPILMEELDPSRRRWLNLGTSGSGMVQMHEQASLFLRSDLTPDIVIFGIHPTDVVRRPSREIGPASIADVIASLKGFRSIAVGQCFSRAWIMRMRSPMNHVYRRTLMQTRLRYLDGYPIDVPFAPDPEPWAADLRGYPLRQKPKQLDRQMQGWESLNWFATESYGNTEEQIDLLKDLIERFRQRGSRILVLVMPEATSLRSRTPAVAKETIVAEFGSDLTDGCYYVDLREAFSDDQFSDHAHLNTFGREALTRAVINHLLRKMENEK